MTDVYDAVVYRCDGVGETVDKSKVKRLALDARREWHF